MIVLPLVPEDKVNYRLDALIVYLLTSSMEPLSVIDIARKVKDLQPSSEYHLRSVRRCLESLRLAGVVNRFRIKGSTHLFTIEPAVLERGVHHIQSFLEKKDLVENFAYSKDEAVFSKSFVFKSIAEADRFIADFERFWVEKLRKDEKIIFYDVMYNRWCNAQPYNKTDLFKRLGIIHYVLVHNKQFIRRKLDGSWSFRNAYIRVGTENVNEWDIIVLGDYILTVNYSKEVLETIRSAYKESKTGKSLRNIWQARGKITVTVQKNMPVGQTLLASMEKNFPAELTPLLEEPLTKKGDLLILPPKHQYVLPEQVNILTSHDACEEMHGNTSPWMLSGNMLSMINDLFKDVDKFLPEKNSLSVIELGPGPFVKPVVILNQLKGVYSEVEYIGVDYSDEVLHRAQKSADKFLINLESKKFIQVDFNALAQNPHKLLDEVKYKQRLFLFIGCTYSNFDAEETRKFLSAILRPGDCFIIDIESLENEAEFNELRSRYENELYSYFDMSTFYELGFPKECFDIKYRFNKEDWSVEGVATVKEVPDWLLPNVKQMNLKVGDKIRCFSSRKPTEKMFRKELEQLGDIDLKIIRGSGSTKRDLAAFGRVRGPEFF